MVRSKGGEHNQAFYGDDGAVTTLGERDGKQYANDGAYFGRGTFENKTIASGPSTIPAKEEMTIIDAEDGGRATWGNGLEFLMSCIAMSIGLGNVWRFPFTAYENGGGAFLIPYIIVLLIVGKPFYYLEMILGQFSSRSSVKVWSLVPAFKGVGWAQMCAMVAVGTYYCSLMSLTLFYLLQSFSYELPWSKCSNEWENCVDSVKSNGSTIVGGNGTKRWSSAELYFSKVVLREKANIDDGVGLPDWRLTLCLFIAWVCIFAVLARGVKGSGKAAYFLAIFPYVIMLALLVRAVSLEGAINGIIFFIKPNWSKLFEPQVWNAAVTQCFFSLSVCFGGVIMYSSYNKFDHNIYRDAMVVTTLDTFTSLIAGFTIFGILGNLAHELGTDDISTVVRGGTGLAFISYPDAIAKFTVLPQAFSLLFFLMLFVLGIGSAIALSGGINSVICDQFPNWKHWHVVLGTSVFGFCVGTVYCTPGGQFILNLVDHYAGSFVVFIIATFEMIGIFWIYGLENFLDDVEFMLNRRPATYWRVCWSIVIPILLAGILLYTVAIMTPLTYSGVAYPTSAYAAGWLLMAFGALQIPFWILVTVYSKRHLGIPEMIRAAFAPSKDWGPKNPSRLAAWQDFKERARKKRADRTASPLKQFFCVVVGREDKL